jgi:hypothetical protein
VHKAAVIGTAVQHQDNHRAYKNPHEFIQAAKSAPTQYESGSGNLGTGAHLDFHKHYLPEKRLRKRFPKALPV